VNGAPLATMQPSSSSVHEAPAPAAPESRQVREERAPRRQAPRKAGKPWDEFKRNAPPKNVFNLRLNDYHLAILRELAVQASEQADDGRPRSMQSIVNDILLPALEARVGVRRSG